MAYLNLDKVKKAREYVGENIKKPDTFIGLMLVLMSVVEKMRDGFYLKSDMKFFSKLADDAFFLSDMDSENDKKIDTGETYWYALLTDDCVEQARESFFNEVDRVSISKVIYSIFWSKDFSYIKPKSQMILESAFGDLFIDDLTESDFSETIAIDKSDLLSCYGDNSNNFTLKFDGKLIKSRAGAIGSAPFGQTLYAANEIKRIITVFPFDPMEKISLGISNKSSSLSLPSSQGYLSKPFLLLAGISGTGKTRFVRRQAEASKLYAETVDLNVNRDDIYCLTSVRPDWHEPSDLLGYISRLAKDGKAEYITTDVLQFIAKAWRAIADSGLNIKAQGERLVVTGERDKLDKVLPYWLCLDEMNLAPVEQYFADYLSVLETREWDWKEDGSFTYSCDALLKSTTIKEVADKDKLRKALGFDDGQYDELWTSICQYGLGIPFNLLVAGTVNMDETTHGFSRKVIDRALSFDFGEFFPNDYKDFFSSRYENKRLTYPMLSHAKEEMLSSLPDKFGDKTIAFLTAVNDELKNTPFELAYRALNELLLAVVSSQPKDEQALQAVWDDFMMCKVLPRIEGDEDKLMGSNEGGQNILERLLSVLENQLTGIWNDGRPDLYRELKDKSDGASLVDCRSKKKLKWMNEQLVRGFVSFWP